MEQLQKDRDYSAYLLRLVGKELNNSQNKDELTQFINNINKSINSDEVIKYVQNNNLTFNYQEYNNGINKLLEQYNRMHDFKTTKTFGPNINLKNYKFIPIMKLSIENVPQELIEKVNYLITNPTIDPNDYQVDIETQTFLNIKENKPYNIIKKEEGYELSDQNITPPSPKTEDNKIRLENTILIEKNIEINNDNGTKSKFDIFMSKLTPTLSNGFANTLFLTAITIAIGILLAILLISLK